MLRKTLEARLPVVLVVNKVDRADARIDEVVHEVEELFLDLDADEDQIDFPILYANARAGWATPRARGRRDRTSGPSSGRPRPRAPPPPTSPDAPLQALVCNLDALPLRRAGWPSAGCTTAPCVGATVAWCRLDGTIERPRSPSCTSPTPSSGCPADEAGPGEIAAVAGMADITIGETLADPDHPVPLPAITVDEPSLTMTIGINTSPLAGHRRAPSSRPAW